MNSLRVVSGGLMTGAGSRELLPPTTFKIAVISIEIQTCIVNEVRRAHCRRCLFGVFLHAVGKDLFVVSFNGAAARGSAPPPKFKRMTYSLYCRLW